MSREDRMQKAMHEADVNMAECEKLAQRYHSLFTSENGIKVFNDLENQLGGNGSSARRGEFDTNRVMFFEGQRSAFLYIKRMVERKIDKKVEGKNNG